MPTDAEHVLVVGLVARGGGGRIEAAQPVRRLSVFDGEVHLFVRQDAHRLEVLGDHVPLAGEIEEGRLGPMRRTGGKRLRQVQ